MSFKDWIDRQRQMAGPKRFSRTDIRNALRGRRCKCGRVKKFGHAVCYDCFRALPADLRSRLGGIGVALEDAMLDVYAATFGEDRVIR